MVEAVRSRPACEVLPAIDQDLAIVSDEQFSGEVFLTILVGVTSTSLDFYLQADSRPCTFILDSCLFVRILLSVTGLK